MKQSEMDHQDATSEQPLSVDQDAIHEQPLSADQASQALQEAPPSANNRVIQDETVKHWSRQHIALGFALWVVGALMVVALSLAAQHYAEFPADVGLAVWIQELHQPVLVHIVNFSSDANWPYPAGAIAIGVVVVLLLLRRMLAAACAGFAAFGADLLNVTLNSWVARPRPNNVQIHAVAHLGLHSFPSGHVTHVIAFYGFLLYLTILAVRARPTLRFWLLPIQVICGYFIIFIGPSRVLEGEHWPSDVVAGYLLGGLMLVAAIALYHSLSIGWQAYRQRHKKAQTGEAPQRAA